MRIKKRWLLSFAVFISLLVLFIGPWPLAESDFQDAPYAKKTFARIQQARLDAPVAPLLAGAAQADITPPPGVPLGGYSARSPKANTGAMAPVHVGALSLGNRQRTVTLVSAEILLPLPRLVDAVVKRTGLARENLYFTASHTHSGPGGYADSFIARFTLGELDPAYFEHLVSRISQAIVQSRQALQPARLRYYRLRPSPELARGLIYNQLEHGPRAHSTVHVLQALSRDGTQPLATVLSFSAHPTFLGRVNRQVSGDYPALLMQQLQARLHSPVLFAAGAVGGMLPMGLGQIPASELERELAQMQDMVHRLADFVAGRLADTAPTLDLERAAIAALLLPVELPPPSYRLGQSWQLSPWLIDLVFHSRRSYVHALRVGRIVWLGYPADYAGELAMELERWGETRNIYPWVNSFNGDYIGYLSPSWRYSTAHYTVRDVSFYGRWAGDYFNAIGKRLMQKMASG